MGSCCGKHKKKESTSSTPEIQASSAEQEEREETEASPVEQEVREETEASPAEQEVREETEELPEEILITIPVIGLPEEEELTDTGLRVADLINRPDHEGNSVSLPDVSIMCKDMLESAFLFMMPTIFIFSYSHLEISLKTSFTMILKLLFLHLGLILPCKQITWRNANYMVNRRQQVSTVENLITLIYPHIRRLAAEIFTAHFSDSETLSFVGYLIGCAVLCESSWLTVMFGLIGLLALAKLIAHYRQRGEVLGRRPLAIQQWLFCTTILLCMYKRSGAAPVGPGGLPDQVCSTVPTGSNGGHGRGAVPMQNGFRPGYGMPVWGANPPLELAAAFRIQDIPSENANLGKDAGANDLARASALGRPPLPVGRTIPVETGSGDLLPSIDTRRMQVSDAIIEIVRPADNDGKAEQQENEAHVGEKEESYPATIGS